MANLQCPLCGKPMNEHESFCGDCREMATNSTPEKLVSKHSEEIEIIETKIKIDTLVVAEEDVNVANSIAETSPIQDVVDLEIRKEKNNKKLIIALFIGLIVGVLVGGGSSYLLMQHKNSDEMQVAFWNQCIEENTPLSYSKYLVQYPEGKFSQEAQTKIAALREQERLDWEALTKTNDLNAYFAFLIDHPNTPYESSIRNIADSLSWAVADKENTVQSYEVYLQYFKLGNISGEYAEAAQERYDYLSQLKTIEGEALSDVKNTVVALFKNMSTANYKELRKQMAPVLTNVMGVENKSADEVLKLMAEDLKKQKIKSISYVPNIESISATQDNKGVYFFKVSLTREIVYIDKKKKKEVMPLVYDMQLNDKKELLYMSGEKK